MRRCPGNNHDPVKNNRYCVEKLLSEQPDFQYQLEKHNHMMTLTTPSITVKQIGYNIIGASPKKKARLECSYTFKSLEDNIHSFLNRNQEKNGKVVNRRFYNRCFRYIEAYGKGKNVFEAGDIIKAFSIYILPTEEFYKITSL